MIEGEFVSIPERVVCSPAWGRLDPFSVRAGVRIEVGTVIGRVTQPKAALPLVSPVGGLFLEWLAQKGEPVRPGTPLARLKSDDRPGR